MHLEGELGHFSKLPIDSISENVEANPKVEYTEEEILELLRDLCIAVDEGSYIPQTPTEEHPSLSDDYIFDTNDENLILKDLKKENLVGKVKDLSKGSIARREKGYPDEFLYVFKYPCLLHRRDEESDNKKAENVLIYIKINNRKIPLKKVFVVSFHKNVPKE